jgi:hypothetical protein
VTARVYGVGLVVLGVLVGALPFAHWYRVDLPGRDLEHSGVAVSGELWSLPLLAGVIVTIGAWVAARGLDPAGSSARWLGWACAVAGVVALGWILLSAFRITSQAVPDVPGGPPAPLHVQSIAYVAAAAGAAITALSLWWLRLGAEQ